jgi:sugar phosphate isomerase/epimerase
MSLGFFIAIRRRVWKIVPMILTGISDEAGNRLETQISAVQELGWRHLEMRNVEVAGFAKANFHDIPDQAFDMAVDQLKAADVAVYCFGSTVMNWAKKATDPFEITVAEVKRCIPRMQRLGTRFVRTDEQIPAVVVARVQEVTRMFLDAGITPVHENCMNHGGMSWRHGLELVEKVPGLKWVFDTANPVFAFDRAKPKPWPQQDPWEYWTHIRDHVVHIHIKDATWNPAKNDADYNWPGEGQGRVRDILKDAFARGYDAGISIEPHMVVVFHDANSKANDAAIRANFVDYGRRMETMLGELQAELASGRAK